MTDDQLIRQLILNLAAGKIDAASALPVLRKLAAGDIGQASLAELAVLLESRTDSDSAQLKKQLYQARCKQAANLFSLRSNKTPVPDALLRDLSDLPADCPEGWAEHKETIKIFLSAVPLLHDCLFIRTHQAIAPRIVSIVDKTFTAMLTALSRPPSLWSIHDPASIIIKFESLAASGMPGLDAIKESIKTRKVLWRQQAQKCMQAGQTAAADDMDEGVLLNACVDACNVSASRTEKLRFIDMLCSWPTDLAAPAILHACREPWLQERAGLILSMRFAQPSTSGWRGWSLWLDQANHTFENVHAQSLSYPAELFYMWALSSRAEFDPELAGMLEQFCRQQGPAIDPEDFVERWAGELTEKEANALLGLSPWPVPVLAEAAAAAAAEEAPANLSLPEEKIPSQIPMPAPEAVQPPPAAQKPTVWQEHIKPFISENWYMVVGLIMVLTGSSLLAYYTWDKSWILRYTIMPGLLALFTAALAEAGGWLERRDGSLKGTALLLRGAAVALLPVNFMTIALLSDDPQARFLPVLVPVMGLLYCVLFGLGLRRWCRDVHPGLKKLLGETLLGINCIILLRPLCAVSLGLQEQVLGLILPAGFYLAFIGVAAAVLAFTRTVVNKELAGDRRIAWFFGSTLTITLFEVFAWIHIWIRDMPVLHTYAPLVILGGGLVLMVERRILELRGGMLYSTESFLGFALLLLGLLLSMTGPYVRILSFLLAGGIWLYQGLPRKNIVDFWIALTLLALGGAAVGLAPRFPGPLLPALGIAMALCMGGMAGLQVSRRCPGLGKVCTDYQLVIFFITVIVAVLTQRHYGSVPLLTAGFLIFTACCIIWRGFTDDRSRWVIMGAIVLALACAYLGCVDMSRMSLHGNTMVYGVSMLSLLWLAVIRLTRHPLLAGCRSSVLFMYGIIAVAAMVVRVGLEGDTPADGLWYLHWIEYAGPVLMSAVLIFTAFFSRSLLPSLMAAVILIILLPELRDNLKEVFPMLAFGTGRASAASALLLTLLCFYLKKAVFLQKLPEGDRFFGESRFPLCRPDHTFLTWPVLGSVLFLILKVDFYVLARHLPHVPLATAAALCTTAIVWVLLAVYYRHYTYAVAGTHLGWICLLAGLFFGHWATSDDPHWYWPVLAGGITLQAFYWICRVLEPRYHWVEDLLTKPVRRVLCYASVLLTAVCLLILGIDEAPRDLVWLQIFLAAQLVWHCLARSSLLHASLLCGLVLLNLLACTAPGAGLLMDRLSWEQSLTPALWFILAVQGLHVLLEQTPELYRRVAALLRPFMYTATLLTLVLGIVAMVERFHDQRIILQQFILIIAALCLAARAHASGALLLVALLLGYITFNYVDFILLQDFGSRWNTMVLPWKLSLFSLAMVICAWSLGSLHKKLPRLLTGPFGIAALRSGLYTCIYPPAALFACLSTFLHTVDPIWRAAGAQLAAPFINGLALALMGLSSGRFAGFAFPCASVIFSIGNIHLVRYFCRDYLLANGLAEPHLLSLGLGLTLLEATALRLIARRQAASVFFNRLCLIAGALVLGLLSMHYITDPNLSDISNTRFIVSGLMSLLAGWYFRNAARRPGPGEEQYVDACEAVFHYSISAFMWCMALMLPVFKHPGLTLLAFWLPGLYFYLRAEFAALPETCQRYRRSAAVISFAILGLYVFKAAFNMIFYPELPINSQYYHYNSFYVMLLGLVLGRLHGLGGTGWLAFYGGLALMTGSYFAAAWLPGLSPFRFPEPAAWAAVLAAHFWIAVSAQRSPIKTAIQSIGAISAQDWLGLRRSWGRFLAVASHAAVAWACVNRDTDPYMIAPLLLGGASILVHLGVVSKSTGYFVLAGLEVCMALHADFLIPSYLHSQDVIWALLGLWAGLIILQRILARKFEADLAGRLAAIFAGLVFLHVLYHHPDSSTGLWAFGLMGLLAAATPRASRIPETAADTACGVSLLIVPVWLAFFGTFAGSREPVAARLLIQALLAAHFTAYVTAALGKMFQLRGVEIYSHMLRKRPRVIDHMIVWLSSRGAELFSIVLFVASVVAMLMQVMHYGWKFSGAEMTLLCFLYIGLLPGWYFEGKEKQTMTAYVFVQLCAVFLFAAIRRQLLLTTDLWNLEYDVWASIAASLCITAAKQVLDLRPAHIRRPFSLSLLLLPAFAVYWVLINGMGVNMALVVVVLYSVMFSYLAKDDRESPYHFVAIGGFVSFVMIILWNKFQIRVLHAYTMPVGIGILTLVQLFSRRIQPDVRTIVRGIVLTGMFMSVGYAALLDNRYPALFNLTMIFLGIASMIFGTLLRLRLFLIVGAAGIIADLISIFSKMVMHMERTAQMTAIGMLILVLGVSLVIGTVYYKTHREAFNAVLEKWLSKLRQWE